MAAVVVVMVMVVWGVRGMPVFVCLFLLFCLVGFFFPLGTWEIDGVVFAILCYLWGFANPLGNL